MEENHPVDTINTKEIVTKLLETRHISKVIYVDEDFDSRAYYSSFRSFVKVNSSDPRIPFNVIDPAVAVGHFDAWWEGSTEEAKMNAIHDLSISCDKTDIQSKLLDVFGEERLTCYSPNEFVSFKNSNPIIDENHQILVLMDQDLVGYGNGFDYLKSFENQSFVQCGLFSQTFSIDEEISSWNTICGYSPCVYPLSKNRFTNDDPNSIIEGLRNILWLRQISEIKRLYTDTVSSAINETSSYISQIDPASFDGIVMTKSETEGCWEFDTLHRIGLVALSNHIKEQLTNNQAFDSFQTSTSLLRAIKSVISENIPKSSTKLVYEITNIEKFDNEKYINHIYSQLCNGDIFKIGDKYYMLLCQPCNLEIRLDGKRSNNSEQCYLIPMEKEKPDAESNYQYCRVIKDFELDTNYYLRYNRAELHSIRILDLVSYNQDGSAIIDFSNDNLENKAIQANQTKRYNSILRYLKKYLEGLKSIRQSDVKTPLAGNFSLVEKMFTNPDCKGAFIKKPTIDIENNKVDFNIHRVGRLKDPWAQEYLQEFMAYLSRPAYPMDFE